MNIESSTIRKILFINLAFIGDVILSTPATRALKQKYPQAEIDMLVIPLTAPLAKGNPYVHDVVVYDKRGEHKKYAKLWLLIQRLRERNYDMAVTTNFSLRSAVMAWVSGAKYRLGFDAQHASLFLTHSMPAKRDFIRHEVHNQLDVVKPLGITDASTVLEYAIHEKERQAVEKEIAVNQSRPLVLVCPAGSYARKSWTISGYAALLQALAVNADCCLIGGRAEQSFLEEINKQAGGVARVFGGTFSLDQLPALIDRADLLITVDTGPLHIAQAVGTPVVALFGPSDSRVWGPRGKQDVVLQCAVDCSPCWGKGDCSANRCIEDIQSQDVIDQSLRILESRL